MMCGNDKKKTRLLFLPCYLDGLSKSSPSVRYRCQWVAKYWPEADVYDVTQGLVEYDMFIFQKFYMNRWARELWERFKFYKKMMAFDLCDPEWLVESKKRKLLRALPFMDFAVVPTEALAEWLRKWLPVYVIPDRVDLEFHNRIKVHQPGVPSLVWYGFSHNFSPLDVHLEGIKALGLPLTVISDRPHSEDWIGFVPWSLESVNEEILRHDIAFLPRSERGEHHYKSDNRKVKAWALGMPVAETIEELVALQDAHIRAVRGAESRKKAEEEFDVRLSVKQWQDAIASEQHRAARCNRLVQSLEDAQGDDGIAL